MNAEYLRNNPEFVTTIKDFWNLIGDTDEIPSILSDRKLVEKLSPTLVKELRLLHDLVIKYPDLKQFVESYQRKGLVQGIFMFAEIMGAIIILVAHDENANTFTPAGWTALISGLVVSMFGAAAIMISRHWDYALYQRVLDQYLKEKEGFRES